MVGWIDPGWKLGELIHQTGGHTVAVAFILRCRYLTA
jgi:hypothetical protein